MELLLTATLPPIEERAEISRNEKKQRAQNCLQLPNRHRAATRFEPAKKELKCVSRNLSLIAPAPFETSNSLSTQSRKFP